MGSLVVHNSESLTEVKFDVSESDVQLCQHIRSSLVKALDIEIIYDQIVEAYWDYKNKVNYWKLRSVSTPLGDYVINHEIRSSLNSLAFNLFNLSKLYLDWHFNEQKKRCYSFEFTGEESAKQAISTQRKEIYESNLAYVVGCKLRSHNQHSALPVRSFTKGIRYDSETSTRTVHFSIFYDYGDLIEMGVPKAKLNIDTKLDLTEIVDGYVYAISQKHMLNRTLTDSLINEYKEKFLGMWQQKIKQSGYERYWCELALCNGSHIQLSLEWFQVYDYLKKKHRNAINYSQLTFSR
ncbi:hypothetical protein J7I06_004405 [Vibrio vulnificus]|uniref:hypothetical protein n=1 Tax=Vibrio vulnificus TaxID=672 RepID=UPI000CD32BEB|nr:hypothetical protein [Vibrio vulnificus]EHH0804945.1 hypothetical protein [Vibrio vulnificus]POC16776.1 hypothetical protein CRN42_18995 [Vibrio vulnificus]